MSASTNEQTNLSCGSQCDRDFCIWRALDKASVIQSAEIFCSTPTENFFRSEEVFLELAPDQRRNSRQGRAIRRDRGISAGVAVGDFGTQHLMR